jgi:hypothetical protein
MDQPILELRLLGDDDKSPLQLISSELLAHYKKCEQRLTALLAAREERREIED